MEVVKTIFFHIVFSIKGCIGTRYTPLSRCGRTLYKKIKKQGSQRKGIRKMVDGMKPPKINRPIAAKPMAFCFVPQVLA